MALVETTIETSRMMAAQERVEQRLDGRCFREELLHLEGPDAPDHEIGYEDEQEQPDDDAVPIPFEEEPAFQVNTVGIDRGASDRWRSEGCLPRTSRHLTSPFVRPPPSTGRGSWLKHSK